MRIYEGRSEKLILVLQQVMNLTKWFFKIKLIRLKSQLTLQAMLYSSLIQLFYFLPAALLLAINIPATLHAQDDIEVPAAYAHLFEVEGVMHDSVLVPRKAKSFVFVTSKWEVMNKEEYKAATKGRYFTSLYADSNLVVRVKMIKPFSPELIAEYKANDLRRKNVRRNQTRKGSLAPKLAVTSINGETFNQEDLLGHPVVLNFWFINCAPCRKEIPELNELVHAYQGQDVVFLAIATDKKESLEDFLSTTPFAYAISPDGRVIAEQFGVTTYPTSIVIDRDGKITYQRSGLGPGSIASLKRALKKAVKR